MAVRFQTSPESNKVKISQNDGTINFLDTKLVAGTGVTLTELNDGGSETLSIAASGAGTITIEEGDVVIGTADTLDFASADFVISVAAGEAEIAIQDSGIDHGSIGGLADNDHTQYALKAGGNTLSGVWDFGGVTSLEIPNGAGGTTVDAAGEVTVDTTTKTLNYYDGAAEVVLNPEKSFAFVIETPVAADDMPIIRMKVAGTLTRVDYLCIGGTNWVGQLQECDDNGINGADVQAADTTATAGTVSSVTSFSNAAYDAGDWLGIKTTSISGTPTRLHVTVWYKEAP